MKIKVDFRPCIVDNKKALFHRWGDILIKNILGEFMGITTMAIIEYEDGSIEAVHPTDVMFKDNNMNGYCIEAYVNTTI
jgi:hypothetical protein